MQEFLESVKRQLIRCLYILGRLLRNAELKDLAFFVGFSEVVAPVKFVFC